MVRREAQEIGKREGVRQRSGGKRRERDKRRRRRGIGGLINRDRSMGRGLGGKNSLNCDRRLPRN